MTTDDKHPNPDPVPPDEPDSPEFIQAALLLQKIWDLSPDSRPVPKREYSEPPAAQELAEQHTTQLITRQEDLPMLPAEERHQRKCVVCHHPDRDAIEEEFIHWHDVWYLAKEYNIQDYRSIYRHARVFGLIERRRENRRYMLDRILETFPKVSAQAVIQALRAYTCLTDDNRWVEPPTRVEYAITTNRAQNPPPEHESTSPGGKSPTVLDIPITSAAAEADSEAPAADSEPAAQDSGPTHSEPTTIVGSATPPPNLPTWNGRFL
jgi:hypothetical protein